MTDADALLAAVRDRPEDDTPRLVYADWLDDHATASGQCGACDGHGLIDDVGRGSSEGTTCEACRGFGGWKGNGYRERAEFIRVQVELARTPATVPVSVTVPVAEADALSYRLAADGRSSRFTPGPGAVGSLEYRALNPGREPLARRATRLFDAHCDRWFPVPKGYGFDWGQ